MKAAILHGVKSEAEQDLQLFCEVVVLSLGIETAGGVMTTLVKRNQHHHPHQADTDLHDVFGQPAGRVDAGAPLVWKMVMKEVMGVEEAEAELNSVTVDDSNKYVKCIKQH